MCYTVMCSLVSDNSKVRTHQGDHTSLARLRKLVLRCTLDMISVRSSASEQSSSSSRNICCLPNMKDSCLRTTLGDQRETMRHLPWSRNHTTPWSKNHTTPWSRNHTTPWSRNQTTPLSRNHTTPLSRNHTVPWSRNHTIPRSRNHTTPWSRNHTTPCTESVTCNYNASKRHPHCFYTSI